MPQTKLEAEMMQRQTEALERCAASLNIIAEMARRMIAPTDGELQERLQRGVNIAMLLESLHANNEQAN